MATKTVYRRLTTSESSEVVVDRTTQALRRLGGVLREAGPNTLHIKNGNSGVNFAFAADMDATIEIRPIEGGYEINGTIDTKPNTVFWVCLIGGFFFLWFLWVVNILYLMIDPIPQYQQALDSIEA
jgi:hypothetical protein